MTNIKWQPISNLLKEVYQEQNILYHFKKDESYLKNAFEITEKLWEEQFNKIDKLKIIMISESPLFGDIQRYIFPFALNPNHTKLHYRKISKKLYHQLLKITTENYLIPKLKLCLYKSDEHTHYVYRYKRLFEKTENHFEEILNQISSKKYKIDTINSTNMSLDRDKLKRLLKD